MDIFEIIAGAGTIGLAGHLRPDGDAAGSVCGLGGFLRAAYPDKRIDLFCEDIREPLKKHIPLSNDLRTDFATDIEKYDVFIALDTSADRLAGAEELFRNAGVRINIDHHMTNSGDGDINIINAKASACCEIVFSLIENCVLPDGRSGMSLMNRDIAEALYTGIVTDSGVFKYSSTSEYTMRAAGRLLTFGFDQTELIDDVFYSKTYLENQLLGRALVESVLFRDRSCIFSSLDRKTLDFYGATAKELDGISSQLMLTSGVKCAVFLSEIEEGTYKVSMRSGGEVNVAEIAGHFGGGGHARAAGMTVKEGKYRILNAISDLIEEQLTSETERQ